MNERIELTRDYLIEYCETYNVATDTETFDRLLDVLWSETGEHFTTYEDFYTYYTESL